MLKRIFQFKSHYQYHIDPGLFFSGYPIMIQFVFLEELFCSFKLKGIVDKLLLKI